MESQANHLLIAMYTFKLDKNWLSGKFHPVLCLKQKILKTNFASHEIQKLIFL